MSRSLVSLILVLLLGACSSPSTPVDSRLGDAPVPDRVSGPDQGRPEARVDLRPDGPRPPAVWKSIPKAPKLESHTVTALLNGEALIAGGEDYTTGSSIPFANTYRYAPSSDTFLDAGKLSEARMLHTATLLADGRVLIVGGDSTVEMKLKTAELYDPAKPAASAWSPAAPAIAGVAEHAAVRLPSGLVLVTGGRSVNSGGLNAIQLYNPTSNAWSMSATYLKQERRCHTATLLKNGKVLLAGGIRVAGTQKIWIDTVEIYDPTTGSTTLLPSKMQMGRCGHTAHLLASGQVLIVGGHCGAGNCPTIWMHDLYDPAQDSLTPIAPGGNFPSVHAAELLLDGRVLVAGGNKAPSEVSYFDLGLYAWTPGPSMIQGRWSARSARLLDGSVLVVGGAITSTPYVYADTAERFFP